VGGVYSDVIGLDSESGGVYSEVTALVSDVGFENGGAYSEVTHSLPGGLVFEGRGGIGAEGSDAIER
jgi:hypothetical protein